MSSDIATSLKPLGLEIPRPKVGFCRWSAGPGQPWYPAAITRADIASCSVAVFIPENKGIVVRECAVHASDPRFARSQDQGGGIWDYTDEQKLLARLASECGI